MTLAAFESVFFNKFGLFVQVSTNDGRPEAEKSGVDQFALDEMNRSHREKLPAKEIIPFLDVPYGC